MTNTQRVMINTAILYIRIVVSMVISLISVPMLLRALGESDYGLYNLIAGVIAMLSFLNASMSISSQRYMSVAIGEKNIDKLNSIYNVSIILHILIGLIIVIFFEIASIFLFNGSMNIEGDRIATAQTIYQLLVISTFFSVITVPYDAVLNAKENMLAFSFIGLFDSIVKLILAYYLLTCPYDRLLVYGFGIALMTILSTFMTRGCVKVLYKEFNFSPRKYFTSERFKEMIGFASWNTLGAVAMIGRNQGIAVIINLFFGTIANAAYGISNQINGVLGYFSSTFQKALNPQLMQSEGMNNRKRLIRISFLSSKFSVVVLSFFALPLILEMPYILQLWLKDVPEYTLRLSQLILCLSIVYQYSVGLMSAIQAVGRIRNYFLTMSILILLNLPLSYIVFKLGFPLYTAIIIFIVIEVLSFITRLFMAKSIVGIQPKEFIMNVVCPTLVVLSVSLLFSLVPHFLMAESLLRLIVICVLYGSIFLILTFFLILDSNQRDTIIAKIKLNLK